MSKRKKPGRGGDRRLHIAPADRPTAPSRPRSGGAVDEGDGNLPGLLTDVRARLRSEEPLDLLAYVSSILVATSMGRDDAEPATSASVAGSLHDLVETFVGVDVAETTALLHAVGHLTDEPDVAVLARRGAMTRRQPMPLWLRDLGQTQVTDAALLIELTGTGFDVLVGLRWPGGVQGAFIAYVDLATGTPVMKDAFPVPGPFDDVRARMAELNDDQGESVVEDLTLPVARELVARALDEGARSGELFETDTWPASRPLLAWVVGRMPGGDAGGDAGADVTAAADAMEQRVTPLWPGGPPAGGAFATARGAAFGLTPGGAVGAGSGAAFGSVSNAPIDVSLGVPEERMREVQAVYGPLIDDFVASRQARDIGFDVETKRDGDCFGMAISFLGEVASYSGSTSDLRWTPELVSDFLTDWLPSTALLGERAAARLPTVLAAHATYLSSRRGEDARRRRKTLDAVKRDGAHYVALATSREASSLRLAIDTYLRRGDLVELRGVQVLHDDYRDIDLDEMMVEGAAREVGGPEALERLDVTPLPDEPLDLTGVPDEGRPAALEVGALCDEFADAHFGVEFRTACRRLLQLVAEGDPWVLPRGRADIAAAAICSAVAAANHLVGGRDGLTSRELAERFGLKTAPSSRTTTLLAAAGLTAGQSYFGATPLGRPDLLVSGWRARLIRYRDEGAGFDLP
ncbi:hypothetical protein DFJ68_2871 [Terracoccus luteus]|uniref:DUF6398 domain-containing protein n=1 Tax=Terracoccus luteus TaxID=53356 RepID=A0A495Y319_9MICO|nr:DUF6398 domain-containing protein [Terracoccus luteus]RKT79403.1 hypothetical protein DFJ68_2871 [Terracoccus luteus]